MKAKIELYQPLHEHLKVKNKRGRVSNLVHVIVIGPFVKICPSERSAHKWLTKMGFEMTDDCVHYEHKFKSEDVLNLERNYHKCPTAADYHDPEEDRDHPQYLNGQLIHK